MVNIMPEKTYYWEGKKVTEKRLAIEQNHFVKKLKSKFGGLPVKAIKQIVRFRKTSGWSIAEENKLIFRLREKERLKKGKWIGKKKRAPLPRKQKVKRKPKRPR